MIQRHALCPCAATARAPPRPLTCLCAASSSWRSCSSSSCSCGRSPRPKAATSSSWPTDRRSNATWVSFLPRRSMNDRSSCHSVVNALAAASSRGLPGPPPALCGGAFTPRGSAGDSGSPAGGGPSSCWLARAPPVRWARRRPPRHGPATRGSSLGLPLGAEHHHPRAVCPAHADMRPAAGCCVHRDDVARPST